MSLEKFSKALQSLQSYHSSAKKKGSQPYCTSIIKKIRKISDIAKLTDWQSVLDACQVGESFVEKISSGEIANEPKTFKHFESILKVLDNLCKDIQSNGDITISIKGPLSKVKIFMDDFTYASEDPKDSEQTNENEFSIDIVEELNKRTENLESLVLGIKGSYLEPEIINGIFRDFHTLKGEAGFLGYENLGKFCHQVEAILEPLRDRKVSITQDIIDILLFCVDKTKELIKNINKEETAADAKAASNKLSELEKFTQTVKDKKSDSEAEAENDRQTTPENTYPDQIDKNSIEKEDTANEIASIFPLDGEEVEKEEMENNADDSDFLLQTDTEPDQRAQDEMMEEEQHDTDNQADATQETKTPKDGPIYLNVETEKVDSLINITGELTILYQMFQQSTEIRQIADQRIINNIDMMGRFFKELQNIVISIRTVSIRPLFLKMARLARELAKKHKKNINVSISGEAAQVDKNLINQLSGPLAHIIRNSIDHGLETPRDRIESNKSEIGLIKLEAKKRGNNTLIEISDDGKGISFDRLEARAKEMGIIDQNAVLTDKEKYELMFKPGLSTSSKVTRTSGRGVGMDVIRSEVMKAKGSLEITSEEKKGTTVSLLFSQTFAIAEGLVVRVKNNFFIVPIEQVKEMAVFEPEKVETVKNQSKIILIRDHYLPLIELENLFKVKQNGSNKSNNSKADQIIVTVENENKRCVLLVDEVIASQEVVVKELTGSFADLPYFTGTSILGNKGVGIILDIAKITDATHSLITGDELSAAINHDDDRINVVEIGTNKVAMIDFYIETTDEKLNFAINAFKTREFIPMEMHKAIPLPNSPNGFEGIITLRKKTLPVFSLAKLLGLDKGGSKSKDRIIIVCEFSNKTVGFLVTGVSKVNYISWKDILPPPKTGGGISLNNIIGTIFKNKADSSVESSKSTQEIVFVLDFEKILNDVFPLYESIDGKIDLKKVRKSNNVILLVEDSVIMRSKIKAALESGGITVIEAENGQEALDIINKYFQQSKENNGSIFDYLDLVISDIEMPQLDGYTFTKTIKSHPELRVLPILLHSSLSNETIVQRAREVHADGFISKCDPENLLASLKKYL